MEKEEILQEIKQKIKGDYYSILGLQKNCSAEDVKRAYIRLILKVHPDKNKSPDADQVFKIVSEAYQCLIKQKKFFVQRKKKKREKPDPQPAPPPPQVLRRCGCCRRLIDEKGDCEFCVNDDDEDYQHYRSPL